QPARPAQPRQPAQSTQPGHPRRLGPEVTMRLGPSAKRPDELPASSFSIGTRRHPNPSSSGKAGASREQNVPNYTEIQVTRLADDATTSLFMMQQQGVGFESM